jgi:hypothetical protein
MKMSNGWLRKQIAGVLVMLLAAPLAEAAEGRPQQPVVAQQTQNASVEQNQSQSSDSRTVQTNATASQAEVIYPDSPEPVRQQDANQSGQSSASQSSHAQQSGDDQKPVGTAAAPYEKTTGVAASRPAGAVIAPGKQRRARTIFIRVSIVVGAAVAVGTVVALSHESPSRPN